jgi:hypothetical protein
VPCSASRVVPEAHRVVGPGTHRGSGPREVHTTPRALKPAMAAEEGAHDSTEAPHPRRRVMGGGMVGSELGVGFSILWSFGRRVPLLRAAN